MNQTVQHIMHSHPITVQCQTPLNEIIDTLISSQQAQLPVVNKSQKLIGMVSLIDCQKALLISGYHCDHPVRVNNIMVKNFTSLTSEEALSEVAIKTQKQSENIFPVLKEGKLIAIMKRVDLLVYLQESLSLCSSQK